MRGLAAFGSGGRMRFIFALVLFALAVIAQQQPTQPHNYWHFQTPPGTLMPPFNPAPRVAPGPAPKLAAPSPPKVCSIPLLNVLQGKPAVDFDRMVIPIPPSAATDAHMDHVTPPAPPCDDKKR